MDEIDILVIDDVAREHGVAHFVHHTQNMGLARSFRDGVDYALTHGADIVVNAHGDNQYPQDRLGDLVKPIIAKDIVTRGPPGVLAAIPFGRFLILGFASGETAGNVQSLVFGSILSVASLLCLALGVISDLLRTNRVLLEEQLERIKAMEFSRRGPVSVAVRCRDPRPPRAFPPITSRDEQLARRVTRMTRWLVVGCDGMLGQDLVAVLGGAAVAQEVTAVDREELDIIDPDACFAGVAGHDIVVNAAAWTKVDEAETREAQALTVNALGAANLARACAAAGARMVRVSTDYVFAGEATSPHAEDAPLAPRGRLMVGPRLLGSGPCERTCPPTGKTTWFGFAQEIFRLLGHDPAKVLPTTSEAFTRPAPRPTYSVLGHDHWTTVGVAPIRAWSDALAKSVTTVVGG